MCQNQNDPIFENLFVAALQYIYEMMCGLHAYDKKYYKSTDATSFGSGNPLPEYSTINYFIYLCVSINFIETWLKTLTDNI